MPEVTVLLPVRNAQSFVAASVRSVLGQTFHDLELLVLDDASTDGTRERVLEARDPRVRIVSNERQLGLSPTLNRGLRLAQSALVARQDADDFSHPERIAAQVAFLRERPEVVLLGTWGWLVDEQRRRRAPLDRGVEHGTIRWELLLDNGFLHTAVMFRRRAIEDLGGYDESFKYAGDRALWCRVVERGRVANLSRRLVSCRYHQQSMTGTMRDSNAVENRRLTPLAFRATFGREVSEPELELLLEFRNGVPREHLDRSLGLLDDLLRDYLALHPELASSDDLRRAVARQCMSLIFSGPDRLWRMRRVLRKAPAYCPVAAELLRSAAMRLCAAGSWLARL